MFESVKDDNKEARQFFKSRDNETEQKPQKSSPSIALNTQGNSAELTLIQRMEGNRKPNNTGIPDDMKTKFEGLSGFSFDDVKVHYNSDKPAHLQALAYTQGNQVYVGPGQEQHLGHELGHVVQQKQGIVKPTAQLHGVNVNDNDGLEREADRIGYMAIDKVELEKFNTISKSNIKNLNLDLLQRKKGDNSQAVIQRLSDFDISEWQEVICGNEEFQKILPFLHGILSVDRNLSLNADSAEYITAKTEIQKLGEELLATDDIDPVYKAIEYYFPKEYLSIGDVDDVKKYNFDGPILFTPENYIAWKRLAESKGTVDDLRYIHHEIFEIKQIKKGDQAEKISSTQLEDDDVFWDEQEAKHKEALTVEVRFLMEAINRIYGKEYTMNQVICSDSERSEEFAAILPKEILNSKEDYTVSELSELLTQLKQKKLGSGKTVKYGASADTPLNSKNNVVQRLVQKDKLNVVGEVHNYTDKTREQEKISVEAIFGEGSYMREDSSDFSAFSGTGLLSTDYGNTFLSKGDAPYYLVCQGLGYIIELISSYLKTLNPEKLHEIKKICGKIEEEVHDGVLEKVSYESKGINEEYIYIINYDDFLSRLKCEEAMTVGVEKDYRGITPKTMIALRVATQNYLKAIENAYATERAIFESMVGIEKAGIDEDDKLDSEKKLIKKRSYSMAAHIKKMDMTGRKGVIKVGLFHLNDLRDMDDFPDKERLSTQEDLRKFLGSKD